MHDADGCGTPQTARKGDWIQTFTGRQYWPLDPRPGDVDIEDIAHHLSMLCRYTGACKRFYSVAEHAWHVSFIVDVGLELWGLHHDDAEYVCNDIARPVKRSISGYDCIERMNMEAIQSALGLPGLSFKAAAAIKAADNAMLLAEQHALMKPAPEKWAKIDVDPDQVAWAGDRLAMHGPMDPPRAKALFLERHAQLTT